MTGPIPPTPPSSEHTKQAFDLATEVVKQVLALSTGVLALAISFLHDLVGGASPAVFWVFATSWIALGLSMCAGIFTLMGLVGQLAKNPKPDPYGGAIGCFFIFQLILFLGGVGLTVGATVAAIPRVPSPAAATSPPG